ncbi:alpha-glucosidase C-terminal domain-containing protein [Microcoleus sp. FACHB-SPT15]|uniref:alpha-amylase family protein n=1 Tax=Microcoleus sp. FACHB-SPT15 TaxID=2692830 RepID=UPI001780F5F2|nr:alpha-amylase family protein [Microcoleus sp. FACHB-SPT15]MBD1806679.1 alpha-glucosidase C-terminal domain-containing protein [Microcoleus sp. FACHB-SPT15]
MLDLWYKNAVLYCLDVETYMDGNDDGIGDFEGLTERLDYLAGLGITCIWLMPFHPTPNRDNGYDIKDYYNVDPRLGTLGDFVEFTCQAHERGMRVIIDLVVNHTSIEHPWFQAACKDENSKYRDFYVWSQEKPEDAHEGVIFPGVQETTWTYNEEAQAYYFHRFYEHQADLNIANPKVRDEIYKVMGFWLELGVSGFRIDAAPFLIELKGIEDQADVNDPYLYLKEIRNFLSWRRGDAILLAEANIEMKDVPAYFGDGDKMQMLFSFIVNQHIILALAQEQVAPIVEGLKASPEIPEVGQWAQFIRNHDELALNYLSKAEQEEIVAKFSPNKEKTWIYDRGIRRRFPPMIDGDPGRLRLAYSLILTLPGTPVLFYGEEIGMGDDLSQKERNSIRPPMQWSGEPNAGFSEAPSDKLFRPVITEEKFGYKHLNVIDQRRDPNSLLNWMERAIRMRKECPEFGWGKWQIIDTGNPSVFAHRCEWQGRAVMAVHNLGREACTVTLNLKNEEAEHLIDLLGDQQYQRIEDTSHDVQLEGYGYRWFRIGGQHL